jgi:hypothetical protein
MLLPWLPDGLTIRGGALVRYALRALLEADAWSDIGIRALLRDEEELRRHWKRDHLYLTSVNRAPRLCWMSDPGGQLLAHPTEEISQDLARNDLLKLAWTGLPLETIHRTRLNHWFQDPGRTLKLAHWSLARIASVHGLRDPSVSRGLALAGIGILGLQLSQRCEKCFRTATPGLDRCVYHSQSSRIKGHDVNRRRSSARVATRVINIVGDLGPTKDLERAKQRRARQVHGAIFDRPLGDIHAWRIELVEALSSSPTLRAHLPREFHVQSAVGAVQALRASIDPYEHDPAEWPSKIRLADTWLRAEVDVAPGAPPTGPRGVTMARLQRYTELQAQGLPPDAIAKQLKMTPRAMSAMLRRAQAR